MFYQFSRAIEIRYGLELVAGQHDYDFFLDRAWDLVENLHEVLELRNFDVVVLQQDLYELVNALLVAKKLQCMDHSNNVSSRDDRSFFDNL